MQQRRLHALWEGQTRQPTPAASRQAAKQEVMMGEQAGPPLRHPTGGGVSMLAPAALGLAVCLPALLIPHCRQAALDRPETVSHLPY